MTKVKLTRPVLAYRQRMVQLVDDACEADRIASQGCDDIETLYPSRNDILELWTPGLLFPPRVEMLWPDLRLKDGHLDGLIQVNTSEYFGVRNVYIVLEDAQGNCLESGYAMDTELMKNFWGYIPSATAHAGLTVIVRAIALDRLGGAGIKTESVTIQDPCQKQSPAWRGGTR